MFILHLRYISHLIPNWFLAHLRGFKVVQIQDHAFFPWRDNNKIAENTKSKQLLRQNHWINFNLAWHKASFGEGDSSLFK